MRAMVQPKLAGKCAVITGAGSGIGRASALAFGQEGASLVLCDVSQAVYDTARAVEAAGGRALGVVADVADEAAVRDVVERCVRELGGLDVMYANAGIAGTLAPFVELDADDWLAVLRVNLLGVFFCFKHAANHLLGVGRPGVLLATASVAGLRAGGGPSAYSASKAAVVNLVKSAACELAGTGIRVNAICPGLVETGMTQPLFDMARAANKEDRIGQLNPLRRAGAPHEIARVVVHLASDDASYLNGEAVVVDGGLSASLPIVPRRAP